MNPRGIIAAKLIIVKKKFLLRNRKHFERFNKELYFFHCKPVYANVYTAYLWLVRLCFNFFLYSFLCVQMFYNEHALFLN